MAHGLRVIGCTAKRSEAIIGRMIQGNASKILHYSLDIGKAVCFFISTVLTSCTDENHIKSCSCSFLKHLSLKGNVGYIEILHISFHGIHISCVASTKSSLSCQRLIRGDGTMRMIQKFLILLANLFGLEVRCLQKWLQKPKPASYVHRIKLWGLECTGVLEFRKEMDSGYKRLSILILLKPQSLTVCMASIDKLFWLCADASLDSLRSKSNKLAAECSGSVLFDDLISIICLNGALGLHRDDKHKLTNLTVDFTFCRKFWCKDLLPLLDWDGVLADSFIRRQSEICKTAIMHFNPMSIPQISSTGAQNASSDHVNYCRSIRSAVEDHFAFATCSNLLETVLICSNLLPASQICFKLLKPAPIYSNPLLSTPISSRECLGY
ncbi:hypothetical protein Cgig2_018334 [Carnegiea gigantea]|uniref:Uncharacterized protein n=1 Tax=Carnegiea gigantea TaxID=171969 RepID=A0A9Q1KXH6_9CARY|nr:hypothetical protein Cgig2_018334 [Carnegiea gigantea]